MNLTVLGASASCPDANDACTGYLLQHDSTSLLVDCGSGVIGKLRMHTDVDALSAILISHFHPDHFIDLVTLRYGLRYGVQDPVRPQVYLPPHGTEYLYKVGLALRGHETYFTSAYDLFEYEPGHPLQIGSITIEFLRTTHDIPTFAMSFSVGDTRIVYTADTAESEELVTFASGADLLVCESTYPESIIGTTVPNHLTSVQAARLATDAGVHHLMLSHFWPGIDRSLFLEEAAAHFGGRMSLACSGLVTQVQPVALER